MTTQELEQMRAAWDKIAAGYDEFVTPTNIWLANEGLRRADLRPGMRFLDVALAAVPSVSLRPASARRYWLWIT